MPGMERNDIMGHEFMGEVVEVSKENSVLKVGDRVVVATLLPLQDRSR
jgi:threonine dehydrogenase-like Zn-dependent dehydrogenase